MSASPNNNQVAIVTGQKRKGSTILSVQLTPQELSELERAASKITVQGARYPEQLQKLVDR